MLMKKIPYGVRRILMYKKSIIILVLFLTALAVVYPVLNRNAETAGGQATDLNLQRAISYRELMSELEKRTAKFRGEAGILVKDLKTHQTLGINSSKLFPSASLVKVPIMAAVYAADREGRLKLTDQLAVKRTEKIKSRSKIYRARPGTKFTVSDLVECMITESDNTAANMLVDALGFGYLNQKFIEFGLKNTDLRRGIMDLKWRKAGIENYTTAEDMALMLEKIYNGELVSKEASAQMLEILKRQKVNDRIPKGLPNKMVVAHKTGLLKDTVSDVGIIFTNEGDFIICVLTADIHNFRTAKRFIGKIAECTYARCYRKLSL
jgi:beta-lactamase class A